MRNLIINFLLFQLTWLALVAGAANALLWPGALLCLAFLGWEISISAAPKRLLMLVGCGVTGGIVVDGGFALLQIVDYVQPAGPLAPWWILGLWVIFSLTLTRSMGWMRRRPVVGALLAGIAAPLSYLAGIKLGAISFPVGMMTGLGIAALVWIPAIYWMVWLSKQLLPVIELEKPHPSSPPD